MHCGEEVFYTDETKYGQLVTTENFEEQPLISQ